MSSSLLFKKDNCVIEFLNQDHPEPSWSDKYSGKLKLLRQTHGTNLVNFPCDQELPEGDGSFTKNKNTILGIRTADCLPVMIFDSTNQQIAGLHAGWKGVALSIIPKGIKKLVELGSLPKNLTVWIGPHIQKKSFEIEKQTLNEVLSSISHIENYKASDYFDQTSETKFNLCLKSVVKAQLESCQVLPNQVFVSEIDTKTDNRWASYRRDKTTSRNLSCIYLKS